MIDKSELRPGNWVEVIWADGYECSEMYLVGYTDNGAPALANASVEYQMMDWCYLHPLHIDTWHLADAGFAATEGGWYQLGDCSFHLQQGILKHTGRNSHSRTFGR